MEEKDETQHLEVTIANERTNAWVEELAGIGVGTAPLLRAPLDERMAIVSEDQCDMPYITAIVSGLAHLPFEFVMQDSPEALDVLSRALPVTETDDETGKTFQVPLTEACKTYGEVATMVRDSLDAHAQEACPVSAGDLVASFAEPFTRAAAEESAILSRGEARRQAEGACRQKEESRTHHAKQRTSDFRYDMQVQNRATLKLRGRHRQVREFYTLLEMPLGAFFDACDQIAPGEAMDEARERAMQASAVQEESAGNTPLRDHMVATLALDTATPGSAEHLLRPIFIDALSLVSKAS